MENDAIFNNNVIYTATIENTVFHLIIEKPRAVLTRRMISMLTPHSHSFTELFACAEGAISINTADGVFELGANDILLVPRNFQHQKMPSSGEPVWRAFGISAAHCGSKYGDDLFCELNALCSDKHPLVFRDEPDICSDIMALDIKEEEPSCIPALRMALIAISIAQRRKLKGGSEEETPVSAGRADCAAQLDRLINEYFMNDLTVKDIADGLFISERQLSRIAFKRYGMTLHRVINEKRIITAAKMLMESDEQVEKISIAVGFRSKSCFFSEFRRLYGTTPAEYRKRI